MQYKNAENAINDELLTLFEEWRTTLQANGLVVSDFVKDGFYPYYTVQKKKILFIGRECLSLGGEDYIGVLGGAYKNGSLGNNSIDGNQFHSLILYIAWALNNNLPEWQDIPYASELANQFATEEGFSFSFMNLSKFSNDADDYQADWPLIDSFVDNSKHPAKNFFNEEIRILNPDMIITMNLQGRLKALGDCEHIPVKSNDNVYVYNISVDGKQIPLYDMFHFSAPSKSPEQNYYVPLKQLLLE